MFHSPRILCEIRDDHHLVRLPCLLLLSEDACQAGSCVFQGAAAATLSAIHSGKRQCRSRLRQNGYAPIMYSVLVLGEDGRCLCDQLQAISRAQHHITVQQRAHI